MKFYLLFIWNDIEPDLLGPFETIEERNEKAKELYEENGNECGYFPIESDSKIFVSSYSCAFFKE